MIFQSYPVSSFRHSYHCYFSILENKDSLKWQLQKQEQDSHAKCLADEKLDLNDENVGSRQGYLTSVSTFSYLNPICCGFYSQIWACMIFFAILIAHDKIHFGLNTFFFLVIYHFFHFHSCNFFRFNACKIYFFRSLKSFR